ncbi:MAG: DUF1833 family protein [Pseudorhodoplanes sp.]|uniref:DUF1833 family protein n=1 Tax=Pseudorhodoplanes sp. TaxID=1934341 RepID=UPI003D10EED1
MTDPWNAAWEEANASVPPDVLLYLTLELQHPEFVDDEDAPLAIRCVTDVYDDVDLTIEDGAVMNGGETVTFRAIPFSADMPEVAEKRVPECAITVDNVARELIPHLEAAVEAQADLICIYREYRSDDVSEPCFGPVQFVMRNVEVTGTRVRGMAGIDDLSNSKFPRRVYAVDAFAALQP